MCYGTLTFLQLKTGDNDFFGVFMGQELFSARSSLGRFLGIHGHFSHSLSPLGIHRYFLGKKVMPGYEQAYF